MKTDEKIDICTEHAQCVKEIVLGLSLGNGEFLLNVMFVTEEAKEHHKLCPEALGFDVAFRTNAEKRDQN